MATAAVWCVGLRLQKPRNSFLLATKGLQLLVEPNPVGNFFQEALPSLLGAFVLHLDGDVLPCGLYVLPPPGSSILRGCCWKVALVQFKAQRKGWRRCNLGQEAGSRLLAGLKKYWPFQRFSQKNFTGARSIRLSQVWEQRTADAVSGGGTATWDATWGGTSLPLPIVDTFYGQLTDRKVVRRVEIITGLLRRSCGTDFGASTSPNQLVPPPGSIATQRLKSSIVRT